MLNGVFHERIEYPAISPAAAAHVAAQARLTEAAESPVEERELHRIQPGEGGAQGAQSGVEGAQSGASGAEGAQSGVESGAEGAQSGVESGASGTESAEFETESPASAGEVSPASAKAEEETEK